MELRAQRTFSAAAYDIIIIVFAHCAITSQSLHLRIFSALAAASHELNYCGKCAKITVNNKKLSASCTYWNLNFSSRAIIYYLN